MWHAKQIKKPPWGGFFIAVIKIVPFKSIEKIVFFTKSVTDITLFQYVKRFRKRNVKFFLPQRQLRKSKSDISIALKNKK